MNIISGQCQCGQTRLQITLTGELNTYQPRKCDCDFCCARSIEYLSDPEGTVTIIFGQSYVVYQHGSNQAEFLACSSCDAVVAVVVIEADRVIGAVNATLFDAYKSLGDKIVVSPKLLSAGDKRSRWSDIWSVVNLTGMK